ncbi:C-terminal binding protein [Paenibacillus eucommiae]|uniref:D-3-phosphoglycerate dehydrogenase n=1 Tax=Paenibacillus eucommiae TaxID=1355755 RepID=A0ABS4J7A2_9BACL|nr:C-terminal binding protein [Paenibacillus eucommiae]MBP1995720.1 D-3-phosphoglycerate dehydrogenase [Paenibacillus eucommiae]
MRAYALTHDFPNLNIERSLLSALGVSLIEINSLESEEWIEQVKDGVALFVQYSKVDSQMIEQLDHCRIILRYGIGFDNVDLQAAGKKGIYVCNVPRYCGEEVAEHTLCLLLAAARRLIPMANDVQAGEWRFLQHRPIVSLAGKTLGLAGCGYIAQLVAARARAFGMNIIGYDPYMSASQALHLNIHLVSLEELWERSDMISLHVPSTPETYHLINADSLARMKPDVIIVNTARGSLVDAQAVRHALDADTIGGIALDVLEEEPPKGDHPLVHAAGAIVTPHCAYYSEESLPRLQQMAGEEVVRVLSGNRPQSPVNLKWINSRFMEEGSSPESSGTIGGSE